MRATTLFLLLFGALVAGFSALNWAVIVAPTTLSAGLTTFQAPLGLMMLGVVVVMAAGFALYAAVWQGAVLMQTRRHVKEMQSQRRLADDAEASRFTELRGVLHQEVAQLAERIAALQEQLRKEMHDNTNSLAAMFGELDERMAVRRADVPGPGGALVRP